MDQIIRVMIVSDHPVSALGLHTLFSQLSDIDVVSQLSSGEDIFLFVQNVRPDVLLLDTYLSNIPADILSDEVAALNVPVNILAINPIIDEVHLKSMVDAGVCGYLLANETLETVANTVRAVSKGEKRISSALEKIITIKLADQISDEIALTKREKEVLSLINLGYSNAQIGEELSIAIGTVKNHLKNIYSKLGVNSRVEALLMCMKYGLFNPKNRPEGT